MLGYLCNEVLHLRNFSVPSNAASSLFHSLLTLIATQGQTEFRVSSREIGRPAILPHSGGTSVLQQVEVSRKQNNSQLSIRSARCKCFCFRKWYFFTRHPLPGYSDMSLISLVSVVLWPTCSGRCVCLAW